MSHTLILNIADFVIALHTDNDPLATRLQQRYALFASPQATPTLQLTITLNPEDHYYVQPEAGDWVIESDCQDGIISYTSYQEKGTADLNTGIATLAMSPTAYIENFLRVLFAWHCLDHNAILLHASGMIRGNDGYAFFGHSGAGKTTTTILSEPHATILSDDLVIVRCQDNQCTLYGVPFRGVYGDAPRANQKAPLKGIFRLWQDAKHQVKRIPRSIAVAELTASSPFVNNKRRANDQLMHVCTQIATLTEVQYLHFKKDDKFWEEIDEYFATLS